jgi:hypothetical protein
MKYDKNPQWRRNYVLIILAVEAFVSIIIFALSVAAYVYLIGYSSWQIFSELRIPLALITSASALVHIFKVIREQVLLCAIIPVNLTLSLFWLATTILQLIPFIVLGESITGISNSSCSDLDQARWNPAVPKDLLPHFVRACTGDQLLVAAFPICCVLT